MKTSWIDQQLIEDYLAERLSDSEKEALQNRMANDPAFAEQFKWQKRTMHFVRQYGRQELKKDLEKIHQHLFTDPVHRSFKQRILQFFHT